MKKNWTYDEVVLALYAYCHIPFNKASNSNPWIVKIAAIIGRTPAAVKMKIGNLGNFDPILRSKGITGLIGTSKTDKKVWDDYFGKWDKLVIDAETIIAQKEPSLSNEILAIPKGTDAYYVAKKRLNQSFFRSSVLNSYNRRCCVTGISDTRLLEACHIKRWAENEDLRTDPSNGICLNTLLHSAYDNFLMSITPDFKVVFSEKFFAALVDSDPMLKDYFFKKNRTEICLPNKFYPYTHCLQEHYDRYVTNT